MNFFLLTLIGPILSVLSNADILDYCDPVVVVGYIARFVLVHHVLAAVVVRAWALLELLALPQNFL